MREDIQKKMEEVLQKIKEHNLSYTKGAKEFGIKVKALYDYNYRKKQEQKLGLPQVQPGDKQVIQSEEISSKEEVSSNISACKLPQEVQQLIVDYRKKHPDYGYKRIEDYLKSQYFLVISRKKIREVLKSQGLEKTCDSSFDRSKESGSKKGSRRFEASCPGELYQMDITYVYITGIPVLYLIIVVDDYSRFCVGAELSREQKSIRMIEVVHQSIKRYGKPRKLLTDQGSSFYSWSHEKTLFQQYLDDMEIEHILTDPHSPETIGKIERFNQSIKKELFEKVRFNSYGEAKRGIEDYIHSYNYYRSHQGIEGSCPCERFHGVIGESSRIESMLRSKSLDLSKGYMLFKDQDHIVSIVGSSEGLQIFMDGILLQGGSHAAKC